MLALATLINLHRRCQGSSLYGSEDHVKEFDVDNFNKSVYNQVGERVYFQKRAFFIEFYSSWCGACINYAKFYKEIASDLHTWAPIVQISAINCAEEKNAEICRSHGIAAYPTMKYFKFMSQNKKDGQVHQGNRYNLTLLAMNIAEYVYKDWKSQRPSGWPDFDKTTHDETMEIVWTNFDDRTLFLGIFVEDFDKQIALALMINFANDIRIKFLTVEAGNPLVANFQKGALHLFQRKNQYPLYTLKDNVTWLHLRQKIDELVPSLPSQSLIPPSVPVDTVVVEPRTIKPQWNQHEVQFLDILSAMYYMLKEEIPRRQVISGDDFKALKAWIELLKKYAPGTIPIRRLFYRLNKWLKPKNSIIAQDWLLEIDSLQMDLGHPLPNNRTWLACRGSKPHYRGYTCGLWTIIHVVTVDAYKLEKGNESFNAARDIIEPFHQFIYRFLSCEECGKNFHYHISKVDLSNIVRPEQGILWLWMAHNKINKRLSMEDSNDPVFSKRQFPPPSLCPICQTADGNYNEEKTLKFLIDYYSNIKTDFIESMPEYEIKEFEKGRLQRIYNRRPSPKLVVGVDFVDYLEESEDLLKRQESFISDSLDIRSLYFVWLSIVAIFVLAIYLKYRRNRTKFWKTFYYNNYKI